MNGSCLQTRLRGWPATAPPNTLTRGPWTARPGTSDGQIQIYREMLPHAGAQSRLLGANVHAALARALWAEERLPTGVVSGAPRSRTHRPSACRPVRLYPKLDGQGVASTGKSWQLVHGFGVSLGMPGRCRRGAGSLLRPHHGGPHRRLARRSRNCRIAPRRKLASPGRAERGRAHVDMRLVGQTWLAAEIADAKGDPESMRRELAPLWAAPHPEAASDILWPPLLLGARVEPTCSNGPVRARARGAVASTSTCVGKSLAAFINSGTWVSPGSCSWMRKPTAPMECTTRRRGRTWPTLGPRQNRSRNWPTRNSGRRNASWLTAMTSVPVTNSNPPLLSRKDWARIRSQQNCITGRTSAPPDRRPARKR